MTPHTPRTGSSSAGALACTLTPQAARWLRQRAATDPLRRVTSEAASAAASQLFEAVDSGAAILLPTAGIRPALPWLEEARRMCIDEDGQRALGMLIAALWSAGED